MLIASFASKYPAALFVRPSSARAAEPLRWRDLVRALPANPGSTCSVVSALAVAVVLAFVFEGSLEVVASTLVLGAFTAIVEYVLRSRQQPS